MSKQRKSRPAGSPDGRRRDAGNVRHLNSSTRAQRAKAADSALIWHAGRVVGEVTPAGEFQKRVRGSIHILQKPRAIAWDVDALREAEQAV